MGKSLVPTASGGGDHIEPVDLKKALEERYLAYALSTIMHRALPDVRDGLKPVHRRVLYVMQQLRLGPNAATRKSAKVVGDVMGKFHPHGDASIYDALVRLSQEFAIRYPLVDGQGNFGNIDGDNAAAMRYTEAKMTDVCSLLLDGIDQDAVDFRPTYNEEDQEPAVLPGAFPNLLANGATGIAVGMATSIPPRSGLLGSSIRSSMVASGFLIRCSAASQSSCALCGGMDVAMPTAMPEAPLARRFGKAPGRTTGSWSSSV